MLCALCREGFEVDSGLLGGLLKGRVKLGLKSGHMVQKQRALGKPTPIGQFCFLHVYALRLSCFSFHFRFIPIHFWIILLRLWRVQLQFVPLLPWLCVQCSCLITFHMSPNQMPLRVMLWLCPNRALALRIQAERLDTLMFRGPPWDTRGAALVAEAIAMAPCLRTLCVEAPRLAQSSNIALAGGVARSSTITTFHVGVEAAQDVFNVVKLKSKGKVCIRHWT